MSWRWAEHHSRWINGSWLLSFFSSPLDPFFVLIDWTDKPEPHRIAFVTSIDLSLITAKHVFRMCLCSEMFFTYKDDFSHIHSNQFRFFIDFPLSDKNRIVIESFFHDFESWVDSRLINEGRRFVYLPYVRLYVDRHFRKVDWVIVFLASEPFDVLLEQSCRPSVWNFDPHLEGSIDFAFFFCFDIQNKIWFMLSIWINQLSI